MTMAKTEVTANDSNDAGEMCGTCKVEEHGKCHKSYLIEGECGRFWVSEEELKRIKLPFLGTKDRKMYDKIMDEGLIIEAEATSSQKRQRISLGS